MRKVKSDVIFWLWAFWQAFLRFNATNGLVFCSHLAMSLLLALFPFILFIVSLAAFLSQNIPVSGVNALIFGAWPEEIAEPLTTEVRSVVEGASPGLLTFGGLVAIYFASNGVDAIRLAMTGAYREVDPRPFWKTRLMAILFVIMGAVAVMAAVTLELALPIYLKFFQEDFPVQMLGWVKPEYLRVMNSVMTVIVLFLAVSAFHKWLPGHRIRLQQILPGVVLTLVLWAIGGTVFGYYIAHFATYNATYAGLAGVIATLIFLYVMAAILIVGAEFNGVLLKEKWKAQAE
ncbi:YihY/virulence factor BrkB family protein [Chachezhania antarctica]|uniref:YihY/virulence factor BrkB family protein n=1 Tax=Chachezhania antarctica TaxID=2340860 RepID=UPI000EACA1CE|nr:YihY/virulence factor BrkB family protein [Chachezhania antarctica]